MAICNSNYKSPAYLFNGHLQTIYPYLTRKVSMQYDRERVELPDGDFLDLDWKRGNHQRLLILCHGLEGSAKSQYMQGMASVAYNQGWDVLALNFRSCSGEINRHLRMYHHGEISDLTYIIERIVGKIIYPSISLCGFSLGGNVVLKYLGLGGDKVPKAVKGAVAISVPCDLGSSAEILDKWQSYFYTRKFRRSLKKKFIEKERMFPGTLDLAKYEDVKKWADFDNLYTTKLTSLASADEYYEQGSAKNFIAGIRRNTLLLNALNDPFLSRKSFPINLCQSHEFVYLEMPQDGGHVGFWHSQRHPAYSEKRTLAFLEELH